MRTINKKAQKRNVFAVAGSILAGAFLLVASNIALAQMGPFPDTGGNTGTTPPAGDPCVETVNGVPCTGGGLTPDSPIGGGTSIPTLGTSPTGTPGNAFTPAPGTPPSGTTSGTTYSGTYCTTYTGSITATSSKISDILDFVTCFIQRSIVPLLFALAVAVFVWGVVKFIGKEDSSEREEGKQFMLWGIIAIAVMFSVWGLVRLLGNTFKVNNVIPSLPVDATKK